MALRISRKGYRRGRPVALRTGRWGSRQSHSASDRSVGYVSLMHARVALPAPHYPFLDSFKAKFRELTFRDCPKSPRGVHNSAFGATEITLCGPFRPPCTGQIHAQSVASTLFGQSLHARL